MKEITWRFLHFNHFLKYTDPWVSMGDWFQDPLQIKSTDTQVSQLTLHIHSFHIHKYGGPTACIKVRRGLPWWRSGWESACQCRGHGFESWSGKIPHATEQLGPWATTTEPARLEPVLCNKKGRNSERPVHHDEEWPPLAATRESPRTETKTQHS